MCRNKSVWRIRRIQYYKYYPCKMQFAIYRGKPLFASILFIAATVLWLWNNCVHPRLAAAQVKAAPVSPTSEFNPPLGTYRYKIKWGNLEAAEAFISISLEGEFYRISVDTQTTKGIEYIYSVRYLGEGIISAADYEAVQTVLVDQTKSREIRTEIKYHESGEIEATTVKRRKKKADKVRVRKVGADTEVLDIFSAVFLTRSFDWRVGEYEQFDVYTGGKKPFRVELNCIGTTQVQHRDKEVSCWVIVPTVTDLSKPEKKKSVKRTKMYLSADPSRDILKVKTKTLVGTVKAKLVSFKPQ